MEVTGRCVGGWVDLFISVTLYDGKKEKHVIRERATAAKHEEQQSDRVDYTDVEIDWLNADETVQEYLYHEFCDFGYIPVYEILDIDETSFVED